MFNRLVKFSKEVIEALPYVSFSTFHCEVFHTKDDEIIFCEIASRTGGGRIDLAIKEMYKVDLNCIWARYECGLPIEIPKEMLNDGVVGCTFIPMQKGKLIKFPSDLPFEWVVNYDQYAQEGETFRKPSSVVDAIGLVLVRGDTVEKVESRISEIRGWLDKEVIWEVTV